MSEITAIILAAGEGKRMLSALPKVLFPLAGRPMIDYPLELASAIGANPITVVTANKKENPVEKHLKNFSRIKIVRQEKPLGTGDAAQTAAHTLNGFCGTVLILYGDDPLLRQATLNNFLTRFRESGAVLGFITTRMKNPFGYGRVVRDRAGEVIRSVEEKEATEEEKKIHEVNTCVYAVRSEWLAEALEKIKRHPVTGEYYLTDIVDQAVRDNQKLLGYMGEDEEEFLGINSKKQLAEAEGVLQRRLIEGWMERGVVFLDPRHVWMDAEVTIGAESVIHPNVFLRGKTKIGKNCVIECGAVLTNMTVGNGVHIKPYCVLEGSVLEDEAQVGPFARLRPESHVGKKARVGNFVEMKKARLGPGAKANHLSYLGDAEIGAETNVGCGTITCNYDGVKKHLTQIGKKVFVGSDVQFVAPVCIGDEAVIGAGSTITEDVPAKALAIARSRQVNKKDWKRKK